MSDERLSAGRTFLLGFGFLGVSVIWSLYNAYVPIFLKDSFHLRSTIIGLVMTIDNVLAILLLPYLGALSDRTRTRLGRRRPYILVGSVLALAFFLLIPAANAAQRLGLMMLVIVAMNLSMALFRSPVIALMPDITPSRFRSQANGIINFMGGLGALLVYFGGKPLYDRRSSLPFIVGGLLMFAASLLVVIFIREPPAGNPEGGALLAGRDLARPAGQPQGRVRGGEEPVLRPAGHPLLVRRLQRHRDLLHQLRQVPAGDEGVHRRADPGLLLGDLHGGFPGRGLPGRAARAPAHHPRRPRGGLRDHAAGAVREELPARWRRPSRWAEWAGPWSTSTRCPWWWT